MVLMPAEKRIKIVTETMEKIASVATNATEQTAEEAGYKVMALIEEAVNKAYDAGRNSRAKKEI